MEYVPEHLTNIWKNDLSTNIDLFFQIDGEINQHTCAVFSDCDKYSDLLYKMEWPDEEEKAALKQADWNAEKVRPIILCGVVINNQHDKDTGRQYFHLMDINQFSGGNTMDTEQLHFLRDHGGREYTLWAYCKFPERAQSIGPLESVRPGTKVIVSLVDLEIASNNSKNMVGYFTDVVAGDDPDSFYLDSDYKIHRAKEYFEQYKKLREKKLSQAQTQHQDVNTSKGGCYVATAVYGSYDCPEVWTLRRYRDNVLALSWYGRMFIQMYYAVSPTLVKWFGESKWFKAFWKGQLDTLVDHLQKKGIESSQYSDKNW